ncbi:MAG: hypothetical protein AVO34_10870 [Firmicutes bacterium ML8_F2]|jgi:hypothetical protein|nr:MAG: hypothetical protein AVO34_10870 [Firmicutes bacterium ML8_F2]
MLTRSGILLLLLMVLLLPLLGGCSMLMPFTSEADSADEPFEVVITEIEPADDFTDENNNVEDEVTEEIVIPADKSDRLPGSLNWDSISLYVAGIDFFREGGLKTEGFTGKNTEIAQSDEDDPAEADAAPEDTEGDPPIYVTTEEDTADWGVPIIENDDDDDDDWYNLD